MTKEFVNNPDDETIIDAEVVIMETPRTGDGLDAARAIIFGLILSILFFWAPLAFLITWLVT